MHNIVLIRWNSYLKFLYISLFLVHNSVKHAVSPGGKLALTPCISFARRKGLCFLGEWFMSLSLRRKRYSKKEYQSPKMCFRRWHSSFPKKKKRKEKKCKIFFCGTEMFRHFNDILRYFHFFIFILKSTPGTFFSLITSFGMKKHKLSFDRLNSIFKSQNEAKWRYAPKSKGFEKI